jgi:hypothetical protein
MIHIQQDMRGHATENTVRKIKEEENVESRSNNGPY